MMKKLIIIIAVLFSGCKETLNENMVSYPQIIHEEVQAFLDYAPEGIKSRPIQIILQGDIKNHEGAAGLANTRTGKILLDTTSLNWRNARNQLVWHEMAHIVIKADHQDGGWISIKNLSQECPSIMHVRFLILDTRLKQYPWLVEWYFNELFYGIKD